MTRKSKHITNKDDVDFFLNIKEENITTSFVMEAFGEFDGKVRANPYDTISIPPGHYGSDNKKNKNTFITTTGLWIYNKYFVEKDFFDIFIYQDKTVGDKEFKKIHQKLVYALLEDEISLEQFKRFLMKTQKCMPYVNILSPSHTLKMLTCTKVLDKKKKELMKKYEKDLKAGNELVADKMEAELKQFAKEYLADDPSLDSYDSGARGSFDNNFKNMFIMKGTVKDPDPNKGYNILMSNYMSGVSREEYDKFSNSLAAGPYARAKKTEVGGYLEKQFLNAYQHVVLDPPGSDCKTKRTIEANITESNINMYMYCYVVSSGGTLTEINSKNMNQFIGKKVRIRFSSMCESKTGICNKCAGNLFYKLGLKNIGAATPQVASKLKNLSMKSFHDSSMQFAEMNPMKAFGLE